MPSLLQCNKKTLLIPAGVGFWVWYSARQALDQVQQVEFSDYLSSVAAGSASTALQVECQGGSDWRIRERPQDALSPRERPYRN